MCSDKGKFLGNIIGDILLEFFDLGTDVLNLPTYWQAGTLAIFYASLGFVILTAPFSVGQIFLGILQYRKGDAVDYAEKQALLSLLETLSESIPQLIIHLTFLSICGQKIGIVQYTSTALSCIAIARRMFTMEVKTARKTFVMCGKYIFIYISKLLYTTARIFAISYFCFYLGWWILVVFAIRWLLWAIGNCCTPISTKELFFSIFTHTLAFGPLPDGLLALLIPLWTLGENVTLSMATYCYSQSSAYQNRTRPFAGMEIAEAGKNSTSSSLYELFFGTRLEVSQPGFCLYSHPVELHVSVNAAAAVFMICGYFLPYDKKDDPLFEEEFILRE